MFTRRSVALMVGAAAVGAAPPAFAQNVSQAAAWRRAQQANTVEAYEDFLREHPTAPQAPVAREAIERLRGAGQAGAPQRPTAGGGRVIRVASGTSLAGAIERAPDGAVLELAPGTYLGALRIERTLTIRGVAQNVERPRIVAPRDATLTIAGASQVTLEGLALENLGGRNALAILGGAPSIRDCTMSCQGAVDNAVNPGDQAAVLIADGTPTIAACVIGGAVADALHVHVRGGGSVTGCAIVNPGKTAIGCHGGGVTFRNNRITRARFGLNAYSEAADVFEQNEFVDFGNAGEFVVQIRERARVTFRNNSFVRCAARELSRVMDVAATATGATVTGNRII